MHRKIINSIKSVLDDFSENELAFLAMTSKIENPLRDRIAFQIHKNSQDDYFVCREFRKKINNKYHATDLAIIDRKNLAPKALIEFKAQSKPGYEPKYSRHMNNDLFNLKNSADKNSELYFIQFTNLPLTKKPFDKKFITSIKYYNVINSQISKSENLEKSIDNAWETHITTNNLSHLQTTKIKLEAGKYYDYQLKIIVHVLGPFKKTNIPHIKEKI